MEENTNQRGFSSSPAIEWDSGFGSVLFELVEST